MFATLAFYLLFFEYSIALPPPEFDFLLNDDGDYLLDDSGENLLV